MGARRAPGGRSGERLGGELELLGRAVVLGRAGLEPLERVDPGCPRLLLAALAALKRAEVREHASGAVAVAELGEDGDGGLIGVESAGFVADPRLRESEPVQRDGLATAVSDPTEDRERFLDRLDRVLEPALSAQACRLPVESPGAAALIVHARRELGGASERSADIRLQHVSLQP